MAVEQPSVVIAANPYEAELCRRAFAHLGLGVRVVEDAAEFTRAAKDPDVVVGIVAVGMLEIDAVALLAELRDTLPALPVVVLADRDGVLGNPVEAGRYGATRLFLRPIDIDALTDAVERIAVEAELSDEVSIQMTALKVDDARELEAPLPLVPRVPTDVIAAARPSPQRIPTATMLRADDALAKAAGLSLDELAKQDELKPAVEALPPPAIETPSRLIASHLQKELSAAEKRLFPNGPGQGSVAYDEDDAGLHDIDLDALGVDTSPTLEAERLETVAAELPQLEALVPRVPSDPVTKPTAHADVPGSGPARPAEPGPAAEAPSVASESASESGAESSSLSVDPEGSLADVDIALIIGRLSARGYSGRLKLSRAEATKSVYFDEGSPIFASSTLPYDGLADLLMRDGKLNREQYARARKILERGNAVGRRAAFQLVEGGLLKASEVFQVLRRQIEEIYYSLFAWERGDYALDAEIARMEDRVRLPLSAPAMICEGIRRKCTLERLWERLGGPETVLSPSEMLGARLDAAESSAEERQVAALFDGERSLESIVAEITQRGEIDESAVCALTWGLVAIGALELGSHAPLRAKIPTVVTGSVTGTPGERRTGVRAPNEGPREQGIDRERLLSKYAQVRELDYFRVLGVERGATAHEIRRATERVRRDFSRERFSHEVSAELDYALEEIHQVLDDAARVLGDDDVREAYRACLVD